MRNKKRKWNIWSAQHQVEAFFDGYGRCFTSAEEEQRLIAHAQYALGAIVCGTENSYHGSAQAGRQALKCLGRVL
jgi:hypothetical protein